MALTGLSLWLSHRYGSLATDLGWTETTYTYIVEDVLEKLDITLESEGETAELHAVGRFCLLDLAYNDVLSKVDKFSADGGTFDWNSRKSEIKSALDKAYAEARKYVDAAELTVTWGDSRNPYKYDEDRYLAGNF